MINHNLKSNNYNKRSWIRWNLNKNIPKRFIFSKSHFKNHKMIDVYWMIRLKFWKGVFSKDKWVLKHQVLQ
jgi:hypothetical protein